MKLTSNIWLPAASLIWFVLVNWFFLTLPRPCLPEPFYLNREWEAFRQFRFWATFLTLTPVMFSFLGLGEVRERIRVQLVCAAILVSGLVALICYLQMQDIYQSTCEPYILTV